MRVHSLSAWMLVLPMLAAPPEDRVECLMVSGRSTGSEWTIATSFLLKRKVPPPQPEGPYVLAGLGPGRRVLFQVPFSLQQVPGRPRDEGAFTLIFPVKHGQSEALRALQILRDRKVLVRREAKAGQIPPQVQAHREEAGKVRLTWNGTAYPELMVRDAASGDILAMAREGSVVFASEARKLEVILTDGVKSRTVLLEPK